MSGLATEKGKKFAIKSLHERRAKSLTDTKVNNASLPAGFPIYYYCISCGQVSETVSETYVTSPRKICTECQAMIDLNWLTE